MLSKDFGQKYFAGFGFGRVYNNDLALRMYWLLEKFSWLQGNCVL